MATWTLELSAHRNQTSPPGAKLIALHQQGKKVEAWWYTCSSVIWRLFFFSTMIAVSVNSYTCSRAAGWAVQKSLLAKASLTALI